MAELEFRATRTIAGAEGTHARLALESGHWHTDVEYPQFKVVRKTPSLDTVGDLVRQESSGSEADFVPARSDGSDGGWFSAHIKCPLGAPRPRVVRAASGLGPDAFSRRESACAKVEEMASRFPAYDRMTYSNSTPNIRTARLLDDQLLAGKHGQGKATKQADETACCPANVCAALRRLTGTGADASSAGPELPFYSKESAVVIFDWDDTLFPTSFVFQTVMPSIPKEKQQMPLETHSPFFDCLEHHAHLVEFVLTKAREVARVAIVTLSLSPWVEASAERFLPGLDIKKLLRDLDIDVYYSRGHVHEEVTRWDVRIDRSQVPGGQIGMDVDLVEGGALLVRTIAPTGAAAKWNVENPDKALQKGDQITSVNGQSTKLVNKCRREQVLEMHIVRTHLDPHALVEAKGKDMTDCLSRLYGGNGTWHKNVLSIGDSVVEQQALKELLLEPEKRADDCSHSPSPVARSRKAHEPLCKTVNLLCAPTLEQLGNELRILMVWLPRMVRYNNAFDLGMDQLDDLERELVKPN